eukprot:1178-Rhodomonas_salina.3
MSGPSMCGTDVAHGPTGMHLPESASTLELLGASTHMLARLVAPISLCYLPMLSPYAISLCYLLMLSPYAISLCYLCYLPTLSPYTISLHNLPTLSPYVISLRYLPTLSPYANSLRYLPVLSPYAISLCYLPTLYPYAIYLRYLTTLSPYAISLRFLPTACDAMSCGNPVRCAVLGKCMVLCDVRYCDSVRWYWVCVTELECGGTELAYGATPRAYCTSRSTIPCPSTAHRVAGVPELSTARGTEARSEIPAYAIHTQSQYCTLRSTIPYPSSAHRARIAPYPSSVPHTGQRRAARCQHTLSQYHSLHSTTVPVPHTA